MLKGFVLKGVWKKTVKTFVFCVYMLAENCQNRKTTVPFLFFVFGSGNLAREGLPKTILVLLGPPFLFIVFFSSPTIRNRRKATKNGKHICQHYFTVCVFSFFPGAFLRAPYPFLKAFCYMLWKQGCVLWLFRMFSRVAVLVLRLFLRVPNLFFKAVWRGSYPCLRLFVKETCRGRWGRLFLRWSW